MTNRTHLTGEHTIRRVAIVGTGLIGASWAAHFLARGLDVVGTDPAPHAEQALRNYVERVWPVLTQIGLAPGADRKRLGFSGDVKAALTGADFVQENGPEREDIKVRLFAEMDSLLPAEVIIASSSSTLAMSVLQRECRHPERCVLGHPFNPPHLIPLVEVVGGRRTSRETLERVEQFYTRMGKRTIRLHKEIAGHVANRLQAALWREAAHLVAEGVVSVADVDAAVSEGPGLRWSVMGPNLVFHLGGGAGGMAHFMEHLSGPFSRIWADLGRPELTPELKATIIAGVEAEAAGRSREELEGIRDRAILSLLALRQGQAAQTRPKPEIVD
ncbi:MAG: 3-hydroxyacyl-CoA dehydrogenase NAD-binding domain-containing protein [Opitutae bacterium]